jgi:hypothetical protein
MAGNIEELLPPSVIENYKTMAEARGVSLADFVRDHLIRNAPSVAPPTELVRSDEWEKALDEPFDSFPSVGPLADEAFRRESIYGREDKW